MKFKSCNNMKRIGKATWCGIEHEHYIDEDGFHILERRDEDGFLITLKFLGTKSEEEVKRDIANILMRC